MALLSPAILAAADTTHIVKLGFGHVPPLHYRDQQGRAAGFVPDVLNEAARRENMKVAWVRVGGSNDIERALVQGRIDIFPAAIVTSHRREAFSVFEPWWSEDLCILTRPEVVTGPEVDWRGRRIVLTSPAYSGVAEQTAPGAKIVAQEDYDRRGGPELTATMICEGKVDGGLMAHTEVDDVLLARPPSCIGKELRIMETLSALPLAVISRRDASGLASRLQRRIVDMTLDGTLGAIASRYPRTPVRSAVMLAETLRLRGQRTFLWTALAGALLFAVIVTILLVRQFRVQRALRRAMAEQEKTDQALRARTDELSVSNEELQAFAYSISHDLREPLRMISIYTQLLERRFPPTTKDARFCMDTIQKGAIRVQEMMDRLLLLSRVGRSEVPRVRVSIAGVLTTVLHDLEPTIRATEAEIVVGPMPAVLGWPDRISVLFQNLIANSLKYRRESVVPRIEISATEKGREWLFAVSDNGIGFQQEYAERIFGVFKRLHVQDQYGGTGVGLAIAKRVVERHGGRIWAEGTPANGSTFYFTIPMDAEDELVAPVAAVNESTANL